MIISYLCIRKKFSKTGNFWRDRNEKVSRFGKLFESDENEKQLRKSKLEKEKWRNS